ncbi:MAG: UDP-N-acetylmuramoyl-L-alanyl-D-glutamate--2,6-diaminopimelate ligase [Rhodocyclaceae bacterium]|nr:UDP-N-acetylmuramoyl-L-alanyl-D-glutamate--2,6-diaminopimelate ligase [Rhodocyclaceae bacterium]
MAVLEQLRERGVTAVSLCIDSRRVVPGDVFVAYPGAHADGRRFVDAAVDRGAAAVLYEAAAANLPALAVPAIAVAGLAQLSGEIAHRVYGCPSENLQLIGVTGTNGKTSVSQWIAQALDGLGQHCAVIGTLGNGFVDALEDSPNTTPDSVTLHRDLAQFVTRGARACAMEVSSIGLEQGRVNGARIRTAVFTNLTRDHLEYHGSMEAYAAAKARLFEHPGIETAVINLDDAFGRELAQRLCGRRPTIGYTLENRPGADTVLAASDLEMNGAGLRFRLGDETVSAPLIGRFNASNTLAVIAALMAGGVDRNLAIDAVARLRPPPGRMQRVGGVDAPLVVIDYAHTPDALEKALIALRATAAARGGKLICLFGCGGERDPGKRPLMGAVAERLADRVIVTSDNPRSEEPQAIVAAIGAGMTAPVQSIVDRRVAIAATIAAADRHDTLLLAGKGHEPYQEIAGVRHPFSDLAEAVRALEQRL